MQHMPIAGHHTTDSLWNTPDPRCTICDAPFTQAPDRALWHDVATADGRAVIVCEPCVRRATAQAWGVTVDADTANVAPTDDAATHDDRVLSF